MLKLVRKFFQAVERIEYDPHGTRMHSPTTREGDLVVICGIRYQRRYDKLHELAEDEFPWVYSQFHNTWESVTCRKNGVTSFRTPTDLRFQDEVRCVSMAMRQAKLKAKEEKRRLKTKKLIARVVRNYDRAQARR